VEPARYAFGNGLEIFTDAKTDFWETTHNGFNAIMAIGF